jgi:very-short-patch-repair endonuclease
LEYDAVRTEYLKAQGIDVMRFWNNDVLQNINGVLARITEKITPPSLPLLQGEEKRR